MNDALVALSRSIYDDAYTSTNGARRLSRANGGMLGADHIPGAERMREAVQRAHAQGVLDHLLGAAGGVGVGSAGGAGGAGGAHMPGGDAGVGAGAAPNPLLRVRLVVEGVAGGPGREAALLAAEASAVASIVAGLLCCGSAGAHRIRARDIIIATPHRQQCAAVRRALAETLGGALAPAELAQLRRNVDTTERAQGRECEVVIGCWGALDKAQVEAEADFIFDRRRLNVAVTRARRAAVLLVADAVASPALLAGVLLTPERQRGAQYLADFEAAAGKVDWRA